MVYLNLGCKIVVNRCATLASSPQGIQSTSAGVKRLRDYHSGEGCRACGISIMRARVSQYFERRLRNYRSGEDASPSCPRKCRHGQLLPRLFLIPQLPDTVTAFLLYLVLPLNGKSCCVWCCHSMANHAVFGAATQSGSRLSLLAPALLALVPLVPQPVLFSTPSAYTRAECSNPTWLASVGTATCPTRALSVSFLIHSTYRMATLRHL